MENTLIRVRRRRTAEERETLLSEYRKSEGTQREFAQGAGISLATLTKWLRDDRGREEGGKLIEVALPVDRVVSVDVRLAGDLSVKVPVGSSVLWVGELVKALRCGV